MNSKFLFKNFFRSIGISRIKRGIHTIRRSIFIATNVSSCSLSKSGTTQMYHFHTVNLMKMMKIHENSMMFELQTTLKIFLRMFNIHYGYLKVTLDIRLSSDIKIIVTRCIDQKLSLGSKKNTPKWRFPIT